MLSKKIFKNNWKQMKKLRQKPKILNEPIFFVFFFISKIKIYNYFENMSELRKRKSFGNIWRAPCYDIWWKHILLVASRSAYSIPSFDAFAHNFVLQKYVYCLILLITREIGVRLYPLIGKFAAILYSPTTNYVLSSTYWLGNLWTYVSTCI